MRLNATLERNLKLTAGDSTHYPKDNPEGYFTTVDITRIFDLNPIKIKMEKLQDWIKREFIRPIHIVEVGRGQKKYFVESQLYMIGVFKKLVDLGIPREIARTAIRTFHNLRVDHLAKHNLEPDLLILEVSNKRIERFSITTGTVELSSNPTGSDIVVINLLQIKTLIEDYYG